MREGVKFPGGGETTGVCLYLSFFSHQFVQILAK